MKINSLELVHIRNYSHKKWTFKNPTIIFCGPNGIGKTNIIESMYMGTIGKSHRTSSLKDMIQWNSIEASIIINFEKQEVPHRLQIKCNENGYKEIFLNDNKITQKELIGTLNTVIFSPEDLSLIKGSPQGRRKFLDVEISQTSKQYYHHLSLYNRAVQQRNRILKENYYNTSVETDEWDKQIAMHGEFIITKRLESLKKINLLMNLMNRKLTNGKEDLKIQYFQPYSDNKIIYKQEDLLNALKKNKEYDRRRMITSVGPHIDDIMFFSNSIDLKRFGSQGQQRTAILSLKLSELEFIKSEIGEYPVLLLDDVLSELDSERRNNLIKSFHRRIQTFITTTDTEDFKQLLEVECIDM